MHQAAKLSPSLVSAAMVMAMALSASPVWSQTGGAGVYGGSTGTGTVNSSLNQEDREMMEDLAEANLAEIETGQLALSKSQNPRVREYAQKMIDDHGMAQQALQQIAQAKGMTLPQETDLAHKTVAGALRLLSGETFESQYINRVGVDDHQRTIELLQKAQTQARDTDLQAMADRMLPMVQGHLDMARQMSQQRERREQREEQQEERQEQRQEQRQEERQEDRQQQGGAGGSGSMGGMGSGTR